MFENARQQEDYVVLIDDDDDQLGRLATATKKALGDSQVSVRTWGPVAEDNAVGRFKEVTKDDPLLVVTDYDLTRGGRTGLFGFSIVALAQRDAIPVGDYSRQVGALTDEPDVFEFRIPSTPEEAGPIVAAVALGFRDIRDALSRQGGLPADGSPATVLAGLLEEPEAGSAFSLYSSRLTSGNAALIQLVRHPMGDHGDVRIRVASYVIGHLLFNAIMRYPGPILHRPALHAYLAAATDDDTELAALFDQAKYRGPFSGLGNFYWQTKIDDQIEALAEQTGMTFAEQDTFDGYRRKVVEATLGRSVARHGCERCGGERGGYWCPFTERPVCDRSDCSIPASSWIPDGAYLTRVEYEFYEEWATLVGL